MASKLNTSVAMIRQKRWLLATLIIVVIASLGVFYFARSKPTEVPAIRGDIEEAVYGLGKVKSDQVYEAKLAVVSTIRQLHVKEGQLVKKGQRLIDFDEGMRLFAPFSGTVTYLPFHESENVFPQVTALRMENLDNLYVEASLDQQGALRVKEGQPARLSFESLRGIVVPGVVQSLFPKDDQFIVRVHVKEFPHQILPGMTADVAIEVGRKEDVLLVPVAAVSNGRITVRKNGRKKKIPVTIGVVSEEWAEVLDGDVEPGMPVLLPKG